MKLSDEEMIDLVEKELQGYIQIGGRVNKIKLAKKMLLEKYKKQQQENEELKAKLEYKQFGDLDNPEFEKYIEEYKKTDYIPKSKIKEIFEIKIHNFNYLAKTDLNENIKYVDKTVADLLKIILKELLEENK